MLSQPLLRQIRLWTLLVAVIPSLLITGMFTYAQMKAAEYEKLELISQRLEFQERLIEYWMSARLRDVRLLSRLDMFHRLDLPQIEKTLIQLNQEKHEFAFLSFIDKNGLFRASTLQQDIRFPDATNRPYFEAAVQGKEHISDVVVGRNSGLPLINFSAPVYDPAGVFQGLVLGSVQTIMLEKMLRENWIGETGEIVLINCEGLLLAEPRHAEVLITRGLLTDTPAKRLKLSADNFMSQYLGKTGQASGTNSMGEAILGAFRYMPEHNWTLMGTVSVDEILTPIYDRILQITLFTLGLVVLALLLAAHLTKRITKPVEWLIDQTELVADGQYSLVETDLRRQKSPREITNLCKAFIEMSQRVQFTISLLKEQEGRLEIKIREVDMINSVLSAEVEERLRAEEALQELNSKLEKEVLRRTSQLRRREQHYRRLVVQIPDCICRFNREYKRIYANPAAIKNSAIPDSLADKEAVSKELAEVYLPWMQKLTAAFATGTAEFFEAWGGLGNSRRYYFVRFIPEYNIHDEVETVLCIANDITIKKQQEADMARLGLLNIVGEMAVGIGHEVRNPLTTVRGYLQLFQQKEQFSKYYDQLRNMIEELDKANSIITDFLSLAKNKAVKMQRGSLNQLLQSLYPLLQADAHHRGQDIRLELSDIPETDFDMNEIRQMVLNFVHNGLEAMESGGIVTVKTGIDHGNIFLSISDTGCGIPPEVLEKLGTPFVTTKDTKPGLGLPICFRVAERHGAKIAVATSEQGTTFTVTFPV